MKTIKNLTVRLILSFAAALAFFLLAGCATTTNRGNGADVIAAPDSQTIPEISSVKLFPVPQNNLPEITYSAKLSNMPSSSDLKNISVVSPGIYTWKPEEVFTDIYVYEKASGKYVACIKNCYKHSIWKGQWGQLGTVWCVWAKDEAVYLISPSAYVLCTKDGMEMRSAYLARTAFNKVMLSLEDLGWQPEGETADFYLYSKKEGKYVARLKDCWRNSFSSGMKGWNGEVKNAYRLITTDGKQYLAEASDYIICNEDGYEYINGFQYKLDLINSDILGSEISAKKGNITVCENPVRELLYICKILSDCPSIVIIYDDDSYLSDINSYFAEFKNHEVLTFIKNNRVSFEKDDLQISRAVYSAGQEQLLSKESEVLPSGNEFNYKIFIELLADFAKQSDFKKFYEAHKKYYEKHIIQNGFKAFESVKKWNDEYLKQNTKYEYKICMHRGDWCNVGNDDKKLEMTINLAVRPDNDSFGLAHELTHPVTNPVVQKLYESDLRPLMDALFMKNHGSDAVYYYPTAIGYWCDTFARASAGAFGLSKKMDIEGYLYSQSAIGFTAVQALTEKLMEFTSLNYNKFENLYPQLYDFLKSYLKGV